jgi:hypothetical protein
LYAFYDKAPLSNVGPTTPGVSGVRPVDAPQPVHYQDDEEAAPPQPPTPDSEDQGQNPSEPVPTPGATTTSSRLRYEQVIYKDEHGNIIPEDELSKLIEEQGSNIEFRTVYETQTKVLKAGEEPPLGAKQILGGGGREGEGEVPVYPVGQNPETVEGEKKAYRTA